MRGWPPGATHELGGASVLASHAGSWQVTAREYARPTIEVHGIDARPAMDVEAKQVPSQSDNPHLDNGIAPELNSVLFNRVH